jgi:hypothetical protein
MPELSSGNVRVFYGAEGEAYAAGLADGTTRERERLHPVLADALEGLEEMVEYIAPYFQAKWGHQGYVNRAREALASLDGEQP